MILSNKKTEFQIQCQCVNLLEKYKLEKKINFFTAIPNSTYTKSWSQKRKNTMSGVRSGLCDLMVIVEGIPYFIELKTEIGTLQDSQKEVIKFLNSRFILAYISTSLEEFEILLKDIIDSSKTALDLQQSNYYKANLKGARSLKKLLNSK